MSPMPSLWGTGLAAPRGAQSWGWAWQRPTEASELGGLWGKGFVIPPWLWGGLGSGGSWALPGQPAGCSEVLRAGAQGWTWGALQTLEEPGGPWGAHAATPTPGPGVLSVHKILGSIQATASTGSC